MDDEEQRELLHHPILSDSKGILPQSDHEESQPHTTVTSFGHEVDSRLEQVLNDATLPRFEQLASASWIELKLLSRIAAPAIFVYLINNVLSQSTRAFAGHLGNLELAAANLGNSGIQLLAYGLMV